MWEARRLGAHEPCPLDPFPAPTHPTRVQRLFTWSSYALGKRYTFRLYAWNAMGKSLASAPYTFTTSATVPGAPTITSVAQDPGNFNLAVDIRAPTTTGGSGAASARPGARALKLSSARCPVARRPALTLRPCTLCPHRSHHRLPR